MLHLHMVSTTASAEEVFQGKRSDYQHLDEFWLWIPGTDLSVEKLKLFLNGF